MIEALKSDEIIRKVGGRFRLTSLIQRRWMELLSGSRPLVEKTADMSDLEVIVQEILQDKISVDYEATDLITPPKPQKAT